MSNHGSNGSNGSNGNGSNGKSGKKVEGRSPRTREGRPVRRTRGAAELPDAISMLELDHRKIESLFAAYADAGPRDLEHKWQIVAALRQLLAVHTTIEEEVLYPAVRAAGTRRTAHELAEALQEHHIADVLLAELAGCSPEREEFDAKVEVLDENVAHHVEDEETELFVEARRRLSAKRLVELGAAMELRRAELTGYALPKSPPDDADTETLDGAIRLRSTMGID